MQEGETLKAYSDRYWEMYNEIDGDFENVVISTFKIDLPNEHDWGNHWLVNLLPVYVNLWTELINTRELRKISNKEKVKRRLSLKRLGISGRTDSIPLDLEKIMSD